MNKELLYQKISNDLRKVIESGELPAGEKIPTVEILKSRYDVSHRTVLRAFQALKESGLIIARGRGYVVKAPEDFQHGSENFRIGLLIRSLWRYNPRDVFFNEILYGIQDACCQSKIGLLIPPSMSLLNQENQLPERYFQEIEEDAFQMHSQLDGFLLDERIPDFFIERILKRTGKPCVMINRPTALPDIPCIVQDNKKAVSMLFSAATGTGCHQFIIAMTSLAQRNIVDRVKWIEYQLKEDNISPEHYTFIGQQGLSHSELLKQVVKTVQSHYRKERTALLTTSDGLARICCEALMEHDIQPGRDLSVIGIDGTGYARNFSPKLTTVDMNPVDMGHLAVKLLQKKCLNPEFIIPPLSSPEPQFEWGETLCR